MGVLAAAVMLNVETAEPFEVSVTEFGLSVHVALVGQPLRVRLIVSDNPFSEVTVTVDVAAAPPCMAETELGEAEIEKSGLGGPPQFGNLNEAIAVLQSKEPLTAWYWFVYQNVQSSAGSMRIAV